MSEIMTAVATPFSKGKVDVVSFAKLCDYQQKGGVDKILCVGATGEGMLLDGCEKRLLVTVAKQVFSGEVWLGVDGSNTKEVVRQVERYNNFGASGYLVCPPSFCKCTAKGLAEHIQRIKNATDLPLMLYNAPSRCGYNLPLKVVKQAKDMGITLFKDASTNEEYRKKVAKYMDIYCGNDQDIFSFAKLGANKTVSVVSNIAPRLTRCVLDNAICGWEEKIVGKKGSLDNCKEQFLQLAQLSTLQTNPVAIKYMLYKMGIFATFDMRLPLTKACATTRKKINEVWL